MGSHGGNMLLMAAVVATLFVVEFAVGLLPPLPRTSAGLRRIVDSPAFWGAFVGNLLVAIVVATLSESDEAADTDGPL